LSYGPFSNATGDHTVASIWLEIDDIRSLLASDDRVRGLQRIVDDANFSQCELSAPPRRRRSVPVSLKVLGAILGIVACVGLALGFRLYLRYGVAQEITRVGGTIGRAEVATPAWLSARWGRTWKTVFADVEWIEFAPQSRVNETLFDLEALAGLKRLSLRGCDVSDEVLIAVRRLTTVEYLGLEDTELLDQGLRRLAGMPRLQHLSLAGNQVTDDGLRALTSFPNLRHLSLAKTPVTDAGLDYLTRLPQLQGLALADTRITDDGLIHVGRLKNLTRLGLQRIEITDAGLAHLADLTELESLNLDGTAINGTGFVHLAGLSRLKSVELLNTGASDARVAEMRLALPGAHIRQYIIRSSPIAAESN
jgi:Leucine Rich repeat